MYHKLQNRISSNKAFVLIFQTCQQARFKLLWRIQPTVRKWFPSITFCTPPLLIELFSPLFGRRWKTISTNYHFLLTPLPHTFSSGRGGKIGTQKWAPHLKTLCVCVGGMSNKCGPNAGKARKISPHISVVKFGFFLLGK